MWSVHTRNETSSFGRASERARYPGLRRVRATPVVVVPKRGPRAATVPAARVAGVMRRGRKGARWSPRASRRLARVRRQRTRCRRPGEAGSGEPASTMRLVLSHTQGVSRPHILPRSAPIEAREAEEDPRGERPRALHEATSARAADGS